MVYILLGSISILIILQIWLLSVTRRAERRIYLAKRAVDKRYTELKTAMLNKEELTETQILVEAGINQSTEALDKSGKAI